MPSPPGPGADAAYGRALAAYERKAYDDARRAALDALAQNPQHGGARALLARIDVARRAAPYQSSPSSGGGMTRGVVQSVGDGTFTITGIDGSAVNVSTSSSTQVSVVKTATRADLQVGDTVTVRGTAANGTITATSIREGALGGLR